MSILQRFRLDGQVAVITGAGRGIGAAIAKAYAEAGADIVLAARTMSQLEATAEAIKKLGREALVVQTDVLDNQQLQALVDATMDRFGRIDQLVNNAGGGPPKPTLDTTPEEFEYAFRFNVTSAYALSRLCAPRMKAGSGGVMLNISSVAGIHPCAQFATYGTVKAALSMLAREMAQDFAPHIRVNALAVGSTRTESLQAVLDPGVEKNMERITPMSRLADVEDIAATALFLASSAACYVTGEILGVHGGLVRLNMDMPRAFDPQ